MFPKCFWNRFIFVFIGTHKERGISAWRNVNTSKPAHKNESSMMENSASSMPNITLNVYMPFIPKRILRMKFVKYIPFLPYLGSKTDYEQPNSFPVPNFTV